MIKDYLERRELRFTVDEDGDFRLDFVTEATQTLSVLLMADGSDANIFVINVIGTTMVPKTLWPKFIDFCNRWNTETRYPKSYLQIPADTDALFAAVHLEGQYPLGSGISQGLLDELITTILSTSFAFWGTRHRRESLRRARRNPERLRPLGGRAPPAVSMRT